MGDNLWLHHIQNLILICSEEGELFSLFPCGDATLNCRCSFVWEPAALLADIESLLLGGWSLEAASAGDVLTGAVRPSCA